MKKLNIIQLAPLLGYQSPGVDPGPLKWQDQQALAYLHREELGLFYHLLGHLHDFVIVNTIFKEDELLLELRHPESVATDSTDLTALKFEVNNLSFYEIEDSGCLNKIEQLPLDTYLYEEIIAVDAYSIKLGILAWKATIGYILLVIDAKTIDVA